MEVKLDVKNDGTAPVAAGLFRRFLWRKGEGWQSPKAVVFVQLMTLILVVYSFIVELAT
ncbi:hypothetical protein [Levilactobacillus sp. HBUAS70063]|uniref:hypothetical protein n=1 Tax=Levilactobacillus sp. HBUAS70063 TaxID=3109359 RepID=UPI00313299EC